MIVAQQRECQLRPMSLSDDMICEAVEAAALGPIFEPPSDLERHLVAAIERQLEQDRRCVGLSRERRYDLGHWTRRPGGIDLAAEMGEEPKLVLMEMKVGNPDQSLWDALKLADIVVAHSEIDTGYLIYDGTARSWRPEAEGAELFSAGELSHSIERLIRRWPTAWLYLMLGGNGIRPRSSVGGIRVSLVCVHMPRSHAGHEIRVLRIEPDRDCQDLEYDAEGWPVGFEPPAGMRERIRSADIERRRPSALGAGDAVDRCHQYPWFAVWTQARLDNLIPTLSDDAYTCLRGRLNAERNWTEQELQTRVDPLRTAAN